MNHSSVERLKTLGQARFKACSEKHASEFCTTVNSSIAVEHVLAMSDFVYRTCERYPKIFSDLVTRFKCFSCPEEKSEAGGQIELPQWSLPESDWLAMTEVEALKSLREHRHQVMTVLASVHFLKLWTIDEVMAELSELADGFYYLARQWSEAQLAPRFGRALDKAGQPVPLIALGMGKLGGHELNFSSDIDLIFCYPNKGVTQGGRREEDFQAYFTKLAQKIIFLLDNKTADGQVFRVDMRLRPFGDSGPLVSSFSALEDYYQEQGRDWERYALLKARPLYDAHRASANELGHQAALTELLRPFVFRRYIDFSVIESLRKMKQQIRQEVTRRQLTHNIKLGEGGIREAEFIIQAMQMLRGGKEPQLQMSSFLKVLPELVHLSVFSENEGKKIAQAYRFLRDVEQLLQAFDDQQTQTLPDEYQGAEPGLNRERLLAFYHCQTWTEFLAKVDQECQCIHQIFRDVIGDDPDAEQKREDATFSKWQRIWLSKSIEQAMAVLEQEVADAQISLLFDHKTDLLKSVISSKGRDKLDLIVPLLMAEAERQSCDSTNLSSLLMIVKRLASRTTYLSLLIENPGALTQLVKLVSRCHFIGQQLTAFPMLLDQLIDPKLLYAKPKEADYRTDLRRNLLRVAPDDLELQMEMLRQFKLSSQLIVAACDTEGVIDLATESNLLTALAEAILDQVVNIAWRQMVERYGYPEGATDDDKNFAVIGYGKMGGYELGYGSDLDIVFVHGCASTQPTGGNKAIDSRQFYLKLAQRILHIFTTRTPTGVLYEIDTRLRPSGASGLMAINLDTFADYQQNEAWTWEHQALVRARVVLGQDSLVSKFDQIREHIVTTKRDPESLMKDISDMRHKMFDNLAKESASLFDLKQSRGGIADIEFITQYLVLRYSCDYPDLSEFSDNKRLLKVAEHHQLLAESEADTLWAAYETYRDLVHDASLNLQPTQVERDLVDAHASKVMQIWSRLGLT